MNARLKMMFRFSLATVVLIIPLIVASAFAAWSKRLESQREAALEWFNRCLASGGGLPVRRLERYLGESAVQEHLRRAAKSTRIAYDGRKRVATIQPNMFRYGDGRALDGLTLDALGDDAGSTTHQLPIGTRIDSVEFVEDGLLVTLHGVMTIRDARISIPEEAPETYRMAWPDDRSPPTGTLESAIFNRIRD